MSEPSHDPYETFRERARGLTAVQVAELLAERTGQPLTMSLVISQFSLAFRIPLHVMYPASEWHRLSTKGGISDDEFNRILEPWLPKAAPR